jgi:hypothetical protein
MGGVMRDWSSMTITTNVQFVGKCQKRWSCLRAWMGVSIGIVRSAFRFGRKNETPAHNVKLSSTRYRYRMLRARQRRRTSLTIFVRNVTKSTASAKISFTVNAA